MSKPILLIDDEEKFALMLQELLRGCGFEADYCLNPEEALVRLKHENYDLVITDYKMPQMDGSQFLDGARKINPDLPVIMISGLMNMPELIKVANIGVTLVLEKPFNTEDLLEYVSRFVHPVESSEASSKAMGMEASEISFQHETLSVSYPSPATCISDASNENKRFLESLWNGASNHRHLPFFASRGAEIRLVAKEIMEWTGQKADTEIVRIELADTETEYTMGWVMETEVFPGALLVDLRGSEWNEDSKAKLVRWVRFIETSEKDLSMTRILYILPTGVSYDVEDIKLPAEFHPLFSPDCPVLLSLRERVLDAATYINRLLDTEHKAVLGKSSLVRLLHYAWPGGYKELQDRVGMIKSRLESGERMNDEALVELLTQNSEDPASLDGDFDLLSYLKRRQREYIHLHRENGEDLKDTVLRLGIDSHVVKVDDIVNDRELAFPGIVSAQN